MLILPLFEVLYFDSLHHIIETICKVVSGQNNYYYDPINVPMSEERTLENLQKLSTEEYVKYEIMKRNQKFSEKYKEFTGRDYLNMYPRPKPLHYMWRADYFGQTHWVTSKETHFKELPGNSKLRKIKKSGVSRVLRDEQVSFCNYCPSKFYSSRLYYAFLFEILIREMATLNGESRSR